MAIKRMIGLTGWVREVNRSWAEMFDVVESDNGPALIARGSSAKKVTVLVSMQDIEDVLAHRLPSDKHCADTSDVRCREICNYILQVIPDNLISRHSLDHFIQLDLLLHNAVSKYCNRLPWTQEAKGRMRKMLKNGEYEIYSELKI